MSMLTVSQLLSDLCESLRTAEETSKDTGDNELVESISDLREIVEYIRRYAAAKASGDVEKEKLRAMMVYIQSMLSIDNVVLSEDCIPQDYPIGMFIELYSLSRTRKALDRKGVIARYDPFTGIYQVSLDKEFGVEILVPPYRITVPPPSKDNPYYLQYSYANYIWHLMEYNPDGEDFIISEDDSDSAIENLSKKLESIAPEKKEGYDI